MKPSTQNTASVDRRLLRAFTLIELLVVIAVLGIVAAISLPALTNMKKSDAAAAATRQMLDDVGRARQFAISQRTTVYMVFVPTNIVGFSGFNFPDVRERYEMTNMLARQLTGYNFFSLREVGDQPGQVRPKFLSEWRVLPDGMFIALNKFYPPQPAGYSVILDPPAPALPTISTYNVFGFDQVNVPFPLPSSATSVDMPCIAFNHLGQLVSTRDEELIPLARGKATQPLSATKQSYFDVPQFTEVPAANSLNAFNLVVIEKLTGRAHIERQGIQ